MVLTVSSPLSSSTGSTNSPPLVSLSKIPTSKTEVNLQRLLKSCERMAFPEKFNVDDKGSSSSPLLGERKIESVSEEDMKTFVKYLDVLRLQLAELKTMKEGGDVAAPNQTQLDEYARKIEVLADLINHEKLVSSTILGPVSIRNNYSMSHQQKNSELHMRMNAKRIAEQKDRDSLFGEDKSSSSNNNNSNSNNNNNKQNVSVSQTKKVKLETKRDLNMGGIFDVEEIEAQRKKQDQYTEEMVTMAETLKEYSRGIEKRLIQDNVKLSELNSLTASNLTKVEDETKRLKTHTQKSWWSGLSMCLAMCLVAMVFVSTYLFIKMFPKKRD
eukprot:TRINITY_DN2224_c0_g1_i2.p1 TRINITY_DN2224_c0_g1~~TRINITY_DN2224_c0_g1_i2.p1  ORF type:complete len:328 (+),score=80.65 TRINITY_DN2224_c0_g1_i2:233-1216(+)